MRLSTFGLRATDLKFIIQDTYESSPVVGRVLSKALPKEWKKAHPYVNFFKNNHSLIFCLQVYFATQESGETAKALKPKTQVIHTNSAFFKRFSKFQSRQTYWESKEKDDGAMGSQVITNKLALVEAPFSHTKHYNASSS